jgi:tRNA(Ile)-lysidine synthase
VGGRLIRKVIAELKLARVALPITSDILIAVSGGSDSLALAHLLLKYGRRVVGRERISILHVNHGWRGAASRADARFVARFAKTWGVPLRLHELEPPGAAESRGESWENEARKARKAIFAQAGARVLTAHQADDVAETLLWRLLTGAAETHGGGIIRSHGEELRPCLQIRKAELRAYLEEEGQAWREDSTNHSGRFLRSRMRRELLPVIEQLFPRATEHLVHMALKAQEQGRAPDAGIEAIQSLLGAAGVRAKRAHWVALAEARPVDLPGGWRVFRETKGKGPERWILESPGKLS